MYWTYPYAMISSQPGLTQQTSEMRVPGVGVPGMGTTPDTGLPRRYFSEDLRQRNIGKRVTVYMTYEGSVAHRDVTFTGVLREVGRDFFLLRDDATGKDIMLLNINLDYTVFHEPATLISEPSPLRSKS